MNHQDRYIRCTWKTYLIIFPASAKNILCEQIFDISNMIIPEIFESNKMLLIAEMLY